MFRPNGLMLAVLCPCAVVFAPQLAAQPIPEKPAPAAIQNWINQLESPDEKVRDAAAANLAASADAIPALREAAQTNNQVLQAIAEKTLREAILRKDRRVMADYQIDLFLERFLRVEDPFQEEADWQIMAEIAAKLVDMQSKEFQQIPKNTFDGTAVGDFAKYRDKQSLPVVGPRDPLPNWDFGAVRRQMLHLPELTPVNNSFLAIPGSVDVSHMANTVLFAGDNVAVSSEISRSIVVGSGSVKAGRFNHCIIIARGNVTATYSDVENSVVIAGGKVQHLAQGRHARNSTVREESKELADWVRFFDISDTGMQVSPVANGLKITSLAENRPPAKAGLLVEDVLVAVDDAPIRNTEEFCNLMRRGVAAGQIKLVAQRDGSRVQANLSFTDWEPALRKK